MSVLTRQLAIAALRRWSFDRGQLGRGRMAGTHHESPGRPCASRSAAIFAGRINRVIDFERVFALLSDEHQQLLLAVYRDGFSEAAAAGRLRRSPRWVAYSKDNALDQLGEELDRRDLL